MDVTTPTPVTTTSSEWLIPKPIARRLDIRPVNGLRRGSERPVSFDDSQV